MIEVTPVTRLGVRDVWPFVRHGLEELREDYGGKWIPEEVFTEIVSGRVTLYLMERSSTRLGFFIARVHADLDGLVLFVWLMWAHPHAFTFDEVLPEMDKIAQMCGAKRIRHESPREGWVKKGFNLTMHIYERETPCSTS